MHSHAHPDTYLDFECDILFNLYFSVDTLLEEHYTVNVLVTGYSATVVQKTEAGNSFRLMKC